MKPSRDIKPENVLFTEKDNVDSTVKLIDFGRSKMLLPTQKLIEFAGSVPRDCSHIQILYMAPEVVCGKAYDSKCDLWSCGVVCYTLLTGEPPFNNANREAMIAAIKKGDVEYPGEEGISDRSRERMGRAVERGEGTGAEIVDI